MSMRAGDLRRQIDLQTRATAQDTFGGQSTTWTTAYTVWAQITPLTGRELLAAQAVRSEVTHTITVRWRTELADPMALAAMRALYNGRIFNIHGARNLDERNRTIELDVSEGLNNG